MSNTNNAAREQGAQRFEEVQRKAYGDERYVAGVVQQLRDRGLFVGASAMRYDAGGSFAVVRFRKPAGLYVEGATPVRPEATAAIAARPAAPSRTALRKQAWFRPVVVAGVILFALGLLFAAGMWVVSQIREVTAGMTGAGLVGFAVVATGVGLVMRLRGKGSGATPGNHSGGMGLHWTPCDK